MGLAAAESMKKSGESQVVRSLLALSSQPYKTVLSGLEETDAKGWRNIRPQAVYDLTSHPQQHPMPRKRRGSPRGHKHRASSSSHPRRADPAAYMSGSVDQNYNYVYRGGLSKRAVSSEPLSYLPLPPAPPSQHKAYHLDPAQQYRTHQPDRDVLARILAMQLKPELLVEQIVIENRLRTMYNDNTHNLRHLNLEGVGVDPKAIPELDKGVWFQATQASKSAPSLPNVSQSTHRRKTKRRKQRQSHLDWCALNADTARDAGLGGRLGAALDSRLQGGMGEDLGQEDHLSMERSLLQTRQALAQATNYRLPKLQATPKAPHGSPASHHAPQAPPTCAPSSPHEPPNLQMTPDAPHGPPHQDDMEHPSHPRSRDVPSTHSLHIPVISPSLRTGNWGVDGRAGELTWKPDKVKYTSKLRSLGW